MQAREKLLVAREMAALTVEIGQQVWSTNKEFAMSVRILRRAGVIAAGLVLLGSGTANATDLPALASGSTPTSVTSTAYAGCKVLSSDPERRCCDYPRLRLSPWDVSPGEVSAWPADRPYFEPIEVPFCWPRLEVPTPW